MSDTGDEAVARSTVWAVEIGPRIELLVNEIFTAANKVLQSHAKFGFSGIARLANPSIEETLLFLNLVEAVLDTLEARNILDYDESRKVLNAKQQIWNVQNIANSLRSNNEKDYSDAIERLDKQVTF